MKKKPITLYTKKSCPQCAGVAIFLTQRGHDLSVIDVEEDAEAMAYLKRKGFLSVPVTEAGEVFIRGFDVKKLEEL